VLEQAFPQETVTGFEVTLPEPVPAWRTLSDSGSAVKVAVTDRAWFIVTAQVPVPVQAPDQPAKEDPFAGVAVRRIVAP